MTDYLEQAIKDVAEAVDDDEDFVGGYAEGCDESDDYGRAVNYAVAQREARLRLEDALRDLMFASQGLVSEAYLRDAAAEEQLAQIDIKRDNRVRESERKGGGSMKSRDKCEKCGSMFVHWGPHRCIALCRRCRYGKEAVQ